MSRSHFVVLVLALLALSSGGIGVTTRAAPSVFDAESLREPLPPGAMRAVPSHDARAQSEPLQGPPGAMSSRNPLWAIPLRQLSATRDRPLFAPSRRPPAVAIAPAYRVAAPPAPPPAPRKPAEPPKPQLALLGTVASDTEAFGLFVDEAAKTVLRMRTGESHKGWVLRTVRRREVVLERGEDTALLALPVPEVGKPGPAAPAPAPTMMPGVAPKPVPAAPPPRGWAPTPPPGAPAGAAGKPWVPAPPEIKAFVPPANPFGTPFRTPPPEGSRPR